MSSGNFKTLIGCIILVCGLIGYITLAVLTKGDPDAANIRGSFLFLIAPASALLVGGQIQEVTDRTRTIEQQTNGALHRKMQEISDDSATRAVQKAIDSPELPSVNAPTEPTT